MKTIALFMGILSLLGFKNSCAPNNPSFEEQFEIFKELGFELNNGADKSDIERWEMQNFLDEPFH